MRTLNLRATTIAALCVIMAAVVAQGSPERADALIYAALHADADASRGAVLFAQHCAGCHGARAQGDAAQAIPALARQRQAYLIKRLAEIDQRECFSPTMQALLPNADVAAPQDWADLAAYLNASPPADPELGPGLHLELGEAIFEAQCAACHESDGRGDDDGFVPSLRNQHYSYLLRATRGIVDWHRYTVDPDLARYLGGLEEDEILGVAGYLARLSGPPLDRLRMYDDGRVGD